MKMNAQSRSRVGIVGCLVAIVCLQTASKNAADEAEPTIAANDAIQAQIREVVSAMRRKDSEGTLRAQIALLETARRDQPEMVRQLLYHDRASKDELAATMLPATILYGNFSREAILIAILPLMASKDAKIKDPLRLLTGIIEDHGGKDFSYYESHLRAQKEPEPQLVEHMYNVSPSNALIVFMRLDFLMNPDEQKPILWADHVVSDAVWKERNKFHEAAATAREGAVEQLDKLAGRKEWWARLYVARILRQHEDLRTPEVIARLEKDEHPLVRKLIAERDQKRPPPLNRPSTK